MGKLTEPTGSLFNNLMANSRQPEPVVGMGATRLSFTDRRAYTVVEVCSPTRIVLQEDRSTRTDTNGMSECQDYDYQPDPTAPKDVATLRKNGRWVAKGESAKNGTTFALGHRSTYHDFSF